MKDHILVIIFVYFKFLLLSWNVVHSQWTSIRDCEKRYAHLVADDLSFVAPVSGFPAVDREFAHMAAIGWDIGDNQIEWNCGGSLISKDFVLTAGHCTYWRGKAPTVVRLGDLDLSNDTDNTYAQQLQIVQIIRHPQYTSKLQYHDIALLRLQDSVKITDRVCPACLWTKNEVEFDSLEACGYGQIGFQEEKTPKLLKVALSPVSNEFCSDFYPPDRRTPNGLQKEQMCAHDPAAEMDTCLGDSGGPLQIKLLYHEKEHPFLIGVTSFGKGCATRSPGVYARISAYTNWLASVVPDLIQDAKECAFRYKNYREPERGSWKINDNQIYIDATKFRFGGIPQALEDYKTTPLKYLVKIGWKNQATTQWDCFGSLITEQYVLTVASCLAKTRRNPDVITPENDKAKTEYAVQDVIVHPHFTELTLGSDIALILLEKEIDFNKQVQAACLWEEPEVPDFLKFFGQAGVEIYGYEKRLSEKPILQHIRVTFSNESQCNQFYQPKGIHVDYNTQICYKNDLYLVPDYCEIAHGAPIRTARYKDDVKKVFWYILTMNSFGKDCGFGYPLIHTRITPFIDWIDSVVFKKSDTSPAIIHSDQQTFEEDRCQTSTGETGVCVRAERCPNVVQLIKENQAQFQDYVCGFDEQHNSLICCP